MQSTIRYNRWGDNSYKSMIKNAFKPGKMFGWGKKKSEESKER